jgi:hypothetical protein
MIINAYSTVLNVAPGIQLWGPRGNRNLEAPSAETNLGYTIFIRTLVSGGSRDSVVGIATGYELDNGGVGVRVPVG